MEIIKSINYSQEEIIKDIIKLYLPEGIECDVTYSKGVFYKNIEEPKLKFDLVPQKEGVIQADCRDLPLKDNSLGSIMFDPPFLATKGPSLGINNESNKLNKRFGVYPTEIELFKFYKESLKEFYRLLKKNGFLIFKIQDKVSSSKQYLSHVYVINEAVKLGFYPKDLFILLSRNRLIANWQKNQQHSRKYHSYFILFQKTNCKISYEA